MSVRVGLSVSVWAERPTIHGSEPRRGEEAAEQSDQWIVCLNREAEGRNPTNSFVSGWDFLSRDGRNAHQPGDRSLKEAERLRSSLINFRTDREIFTGCKEYESM